MDKTYQPNKHEKEIYQLWEKSGFFNPDKLPGNRQENFSIVIPPPNITGFLHMGHALNNTIQDILIRFARMKGKRAVWIPGTDHAGIATQNVIEKKLKQAGQTRHEIGRDQFITKAWEWKEEYGNLIFKQLKKMGCSCDWSRTRFTLDKEYIEAVQTAFIKYHEKGYIYRGPRIVNWCPRCTTAISDIEIKYKEQPSKLWYLKYPLKDNPKKFIIIATTRPETMLGDTAVAVNSKDKRYKDLIGEELLLPIVSRTIPIIEHYLVDPEFGTGALKITPAHDNADWQIGKDNNLEVINVIDINGNMDKNTGEYAGLNALQARKKIVEEFKKLNLLEKIEDYQHQISLCDRCDTPIEPQISKQWFVKMNKLSKPAIKIVQQEKIKIIPERYQKIYLDWLTNIEDWCISRQLWWGHRLPVWFCANDKEKYIVSDKQPNKCSFCKKCKPKQSEDVLDTWFSSALWPFAILGWPNKTKDLANYYPTSVLSTARDIIYLWVARMVFSSTEFLDKQPFDNVYIHATILTATGKRMSKSLGTGIDPLELIDKYGADATRFGLMRQTNRDQQAMRFDERTILAARNFINKIWNISRFIDIQTKDEQTEITNIKTNTLADKWIVSKANSLIVLVDKQIKEYEFGKACQNIYEFVWHEFADWYLEIAKLQTNNTAIKKSTIRILRLILCISLRIMHPFIPFVTEQIYQQFNNCSDPLADLLIVAKWPKQKTEFIDSQSEKKFAEIQEIITSIRSYKKEATINNKEIIDYKIEPNVKKSLDQEQRDLITKIGKVKIV